jgi:hypothetical protein
VVCILYIIHFVCVCVCVCMCCVRVRTICAHGSPVHTESRVSAAILLPSQWRSLIPHATAVCRTIVKRKGKRKPRRSIMCYDNNIVAIVPIVQAYYNMIHISEYIYTTHISQLHRYIYIGTCNYLPIRGNDISTITSINCFCQPFDIS